ncbi:MAG: RNA polymerase sigma factor [Phycisphaerales bacterium]|jgi:RNA polymerase sigma-70 factor (ECF subfamily)|nr:sigma-70 family RNA polymerase sigma factor [Planctomycetota bacterium]
MSDSREIDPTPERLQREIAAAAGGDESAWRRIVEWFAPRVFGLIRAQCGDVELAEEITQSTFCTLAEKLERYVETGKFEAWLFRIAVNRLRDEMRRRRRHAVPIESSVLADLAPPSEDAEPVDRQRLFTALAKALGELGDSDREVVELRHLGGMSFRQMAEHLGEPLGTLLARHHRALRKLRGALRPEIADELEDL